MALTDVEIQKINGLFAEIDKLTKKNAAITLDLQKCELELKNSNIKNVKLTTSLNQRQSEIVKLQQDISILKETSRFTSKLVDELKDDIKSIMDYVVKKAPRTRKKTATK